MIYSRKGDEKKALDYLTRSFKIAEELNDKRIMPLPLISIGRYHFIKQEYNKALDCFTQSLTIQKEIKLKIHEVPLLTNTYIALIYKFQGQKYNIDNIHHLIKKCPNIVYNLNYLIF